jgi:hypothetical protein
VEGSAHSPGAAQRLDQTAARTQQHGMQQWAVLWTGSACVRQLGAACHTRYGAMASSGTSVTALSCAALYVITVPRAAAGMLRVQQPAVCWRGVAAESGCLVRKACMLSIAG